MVAGDLFLLGLLIGALVAAWWIKRRQAQRLAARLRRARRAEKDAIRFLTEKGYRVVDVQRREPVVMVIDGREYKGAVRADIVARKGRKTYIVEVKSGRQGEDPGKAEIRRQLLEYFLVYRPHGLLLLDMQGRKMHLISFRLGGNWYNKLQGLPEIWRYALAGSLGALITWLGLASGWGK
ncbi:MAG: hypothetical protein IMW96_10695 [Thermoanaerobacteraceae bacterium]|uniref:hypothetical protein n=1 Tax=Thermanaeromonas sp. C210 TaxID=2731925 RepID=UPI00155CAA17|nr:hypothetical protein [Thermanaeromonas sp. C210]MBE3582079.1 hypothetical protein [Thermoanaerobacteraceae bacterium]GFN23332.1 hypothetical protein TAMC210_16490 [Thermanaeromonas sp. C210]